MRNEFGIFVPRKIFLHDPIVFVAIVGYSSGKWRIWVLLPGPIRITCGNLKLSLRSGITSDKRPLGSGETARLLWINRAI